MTKNNRKSWKKLKALSFIFQVWKVDYKKEYFEIFRDFKALDTVLPPLPCPDILRVCVPLGLSDKTEQVQNNCRNGGLEEGRSRG